MSEGVRLECWLLYFIGLLFGYYDYGYCHVIGVLGEMPGRVLIGLLFRSLGSKLEYRHWVDEYRDGFVRPPDAMDRGRRERDDGTTKTRAKRWNDESDGACIVRGRWQRLGAHEGFPFASLIRFFH